MRADIRQTPVAAKMLRCFLDGVEITNDCVAADEESGIAVCLKRDSGGHAFVEDKTGSVAKEILEGIIELRFIDSVTPPIRARLIEILRATKPIV